MKIAENVLADTIRETYEKPVCQVKRFTVDQVLGASGGSKSSREPGGGSDGTATENAPWN